jgi:[ribosomal protein S5]-alanine N-acetyltransferase
VRRSSSTRSPVLNPELIRSARLVLPSLSLEQMERLVAGDARSVGRELGAVLSEGWRSAIAPLAKIRIPQLRDDPALAPWLLRAILLADRQREDARPAIGFINFHDGPADRGWVEIGYSIGPDWRRQGYATEAVRALLGWAQTQGVHRFLASISPSNAPSLALVARLGFAWIGQQWDPDDGPELIFERDGVP